MPNGRTTGYAAQELDRADRKPVLVAVAIAILLHAGLLAARLPEEPERARIETPAEELAMAVLFLDPPRPLPPQAPPPEPLKREARKVPRPDPTPDEPEPLVVPPPPPPARWPQALPPLPAPSTLAAPASMPAPVPPEPAPPEPGPIRVASGQGPGIVKRVEPLYPPSARAMGLEGAVELDAIILEDGTVGEVRVVRSAHPILDAAAARALAQWRFSPGTRDVIMTLTVRFELDRAR